MHSHRKVCSCCVLLGGCHSSTSLISSGLVLIPSLLTTCPRKSTLSLSSWHLFGFSFKAYLWRLSKTSAKCFRFCSTPLQYNYVIQIDKEDLPLKPSQNDLHGSLEGARCITWAKVHSGIFIEGLAGNKCFFASIFWVYSNLPVPTLKMQGRENGSLSPHIKTFFHLRQWKSTLQSAKGDWDFKSSSISLTC